MNPSYQPPGPQQTFTQSMPPPDGPSSYQRSAVASQYPLPAPRQLLQYRTSYSSAPSQPQQHHQHEASIIPPHHPTAPPPPPTQHYQQQHIQKQQLNPVNPYYSSRRDNFTTELPQPPITAAPAEAGPMLTPISTIDEVVGFRYQLEVVQQPKRARMCGFGDKDRRPITPPPCVRLCITSLATGKEINYSEIDHAMFVLNVDLWNIEGSREVNLVRSSAAGSAAAASASTGLSNFVPRMGPEGPSMRGLLQGRDVTFGQQALYASEFSRPSDYHAASCTFAPSTQRHPHQTVYRQDQSHALQNNGGTYSRTASLYENYGQEQGSMSKMSAVGGQPQGMFTRNLIGSVAVSAFNLCDTEEKRGIWFVLQDLSVRTEGNFRLRFSFVNVGPRGGQTPTDGNPPKVTTGRAAILASAFSEPFSVFSAKKFPGVCESTPLSKTFAAQGIKIPIRKEAGGKGDEEDYAD